MKKIIFMLLGTAMLVSALCMTGSAAADTTAAKAESLGSGALTVKYNGEAIVFPDAQPFIDENSRTLIPVRFVAETMGAKVSWNQEAQAAVIEQNGITVSVPIGSDTISITQDGSTSTVKMDTAALIREERTYVPIRYVAEALGAWVGYSDLFTTVQIYRDVLTPDEITRLHSYYDMTWEEYYKSIGETTALTDADIQDINPQIAYFNGTFGFENANEWKLRNPNGVETLKYTNKTPTTYTGKTSGLTFKFGTQPYIEYAKLILAEAYRAQDDLNAQGKAVFALKTDLSCVYASRHGSSAGTYVRGVITVSIPADADISWIQANYDFIPNPKAGETRDIDVEIYVNTFTSSVFWGELVALK